MISTDHPETQLLEIGRSALQIEAQAISQAANRLDANFGQAVTLIHQQTGKVGVIGVGKSGQVAAKIAATFCSIGVPAIYLSPTEALHGGLGIYSPGDPTLLISKSGATAELLQLLPSLRNLKSPLIAILGNLESPLAREADIVLDARVEREAEPLNLAPTASSTVALALGDALAAALVHLRGFSKPAFAALHPQGQLGRNLWLCVSDVMQNETQIAWVSAITSLHQVVIEMTRHPLGAACVVDDQRHLIGLITDGDLRRTLQTYTDIRELRAETLMTLNPITILPTAKLEEALNLMENRPTQISVLPVVNSANRCIGLLRLHDIYRAHSL